MRRFNRLSILLAAAAWAASASYAADPITPTRVSADGATITVDVDGAPLKELLDELRKQAGFALVESSATLQRPVTIRLEEVPWRDGLAELLQGYRYALAMDPATDRPTTLVILSSEVGESAGAEGPESSQTESEGVETADSGPADATNESSLAEAIRLANELAAQQEDPLQFAMRRAREAAAEAERQAREQELQRRAAEGEDATEARRGNPQDGYDRYADSLRELGRFQDPERMDVLAPALESESRTVRGAALEALRDGTVSDAAVLDRVRSMITGDSEPGIQRKALEVYVRYGDPSDVLSLVQSLGRVDGPTRDIAVREWIRIEKELAEAPLADQQLTSARR